MCQIMANLPTKYDSNLRISDHRVTRHTCTKRKMSTFWLRLIACSVPLLLHHSATVQWMLIELMATCVFNSISAELGSAVQGVQGFFHLPYFWPRLFDSGPEHLTSGCPLAANSCITFAAAEGRCHLKPTWLRKVYTAYTSLVDVSIFVTPHFTVQELDGIKCCASFRRLHHHHRSGM